MKKIFRMAMVCALAGATLLYTGCTKDYSEDISNLESRLNTLEGTTIKSLQDQITDLQTAKASLESAVAAAQTAINGLKDRASSLESAVAALETAKKNLEKKVGDNAAAITAIEGNIATLKNDLATLTSRVATLEDAVAKNKTAIEKIEADLAKKADKSYVDGELAKKADLQYVKDTYATITYVDNAVAELNGAIKTIQGDITNIKSDLSAANTAISGLQGDMTQAKSAITTLQGEMSQAKTDIIAAKNAADKAQEDATKALTEIDNIKEALKAIYTKAEVDAIVKNLDSTINARIDVLEGRVAANEEAIAGLDSTVASHKALIDNLQEQIDETNKAIDTLKDTKLDIAAYQQDTAKLNQRLAAIDQKILDVIEDYQNADQALQAQIDTLDAKVADLYETKLDKTTFEDFKTELDERLNALSADINKLLKRIQSLVYVPDYADGKIRIPYSVMIDEQGYVTFPGGDKVPAGFLGINFQQGGQGGQNIPVYGPVTRSEEEAVKCEVVTEKTTEVKFRVYGEDAAELALALTEATDSLAFDVVSVKPNTRVNEAGAAVEILGAEVDELDNDIIVITIRPNSLGDAFYIGSPQIGLEPTSYSMSLVLTDAEKTNLIQSCYVNMVPGDKVEAIVPGIYVGEENVTNKADTVEVEYTNLEATEILPEAELKFAVGDTLYTYDELIELGYSIPEPVDTVYNEDYSKPNAWTDLYEAINADSVKADYFVADTVSRPATITLKEVNKYAVGAKKANLLEYTIGNTKVGSAQIEVVVPVQITIESHAWESEAVDPFTWTYKLDAAADSLALADTTAAPAYKRDSAVVKISKGLDSLKLVGYDLAGLLAGQTVTGGVYVADENYEYTDADAVDDIEIRPFLGEDGTLYAKVNGFDFANQYYAVEMVILLPDAQQPAVEVTFKSGFCTSDRNREDIVITLPEHTVDFDIALRDTSYYVKDDAESIVPPFYLSDEDAIDAFMNHALDTAKGLSMIYPEVPDTLVFEEDVTTKHPYMQLYTEGCEEDVLDFTTFFNIKSPILKGDTLGTQFDYVDTVDLWYGQRVIVKKTLKINVEDIYEFERINEYVVWDPANLLHTSYTTLQPWWTPDDATLDMTLPVESYDAHEVLLDQHFRLRDQKTGEQITNLDGTIKDDYSFLHREFVLENAEGEEVTEIADPRNAITADSVAAATGVKVADNIVEYYSMAEYTDVYGHLYARIPGNKAIMPLKTRFDKANANWPVVKNPAEEDYTSYAIKLYDPLQAIVAPTEAQRVNINNSVVRPTSIYDFLSLKDKRGWETIDGQSENGWVVGTGENGFAAETSADEVYSLTFTNTMEYVTEVSDETKARINFDPESGKITFDNTLQTQLAQEIELNLGIIVEYPWGQRIANVTVVFYNTPVGE